MVLGSDRDARMLALLGVLILHALFAWLLLLSLVPSFVRQGETRLAVFQIAPERVPPPAPRIEPERRITRRPEGAAAPSNLRAEPKAIVAPTPVIRIQPRQSPPAPAVAGSGTSASAGAADRAGPGTGAGGEGNGRGSGRAGEGTGGLRVVVRAQLRSGSIYPRDYPRAANGDQGTVAARVEVSAAGVVTSCTVARSSGNPVLDATTCRLIRERFRYAPARDSEGNAAPDVKGWQQRWWRD